MRELIRARVSGRRPLAEAVVGLTLEGLDARLPAWTPGAHIDLVLPSGAVRQYSLCGPLNAHNRYEVAILREENGRGGSVEAHDRLTPGREVQITTPKNRFPLVRAQKYLFIAGGIGITPLLPMVEAVDRLGLDWHLLYGGRSRRSMAFLDHLDLLDLDGDHVTVVPQDERGLLDLPAAITSHPEALIYTCGPAPMLDAVQHVAGAGDRAVHLERFVASPQAPVTDAALGGNPSDDALEVQLGRDGPVVTVTPETSILEAVLAAGADTLFSCEEGTCGSCETRVLEGTVDHRDQLLTEAEREGGLMLICVSRARSARLVLDIRPSRAARG